VFVESFVVNLTKIPLDRFIHHGDQTASVLLGQVAIFAIQVVVRLGAKSPCNVSWFDTESSGVGSK